MPPEPEKAFRWRLEDAYRTVSGEAFAKLVHENGLEVKGPFSGYYYAMKSTIEGQELYRTAVGPTMAAAPTAPAAGANYSFTATKRCFVYALNFSLVTSADVANRALEFGVDKGSGLAMIYKLFSTQTASRTNYYYLAAGYTNSDGADQVARYQAIPSCVALAIGDRITVSIANKSATDQLTPGWIMTEADG